jgi:hypothetical protein
VAQAPVRGAQSFVGIMAQVWKRPSLTTFEVAWRWIAGLLLVILARQALRGAGVEAGFDTAPLQSVTVFRPVEAIQTFGAVIAPVWAHALPILDWLVPLTFLLWNGFASLGRSVTLRRLDPTLHVRRFSLFVLGTLRALLLLFTWLLWSRGVLLAVHVAITNPAARGQEPSVVLFAAMLISGTLVLYVIWGILSWPFHLAPLLAMMRDLGPVAALQAAFASRRVRGKLIEINLVMNIVRIALIVLAMVASASPLPFTTVATQGFLQIWWCLTILAYLAMNDYFHVVRAASYLSLYRSLEVAQIPA